jgi:hypothetical protein
MGNARAGRIGPAPVKILRCNALVAKAHCFALSNRPNSAISRLRFLQMAHRDISLRCRTSSLSGDSGHRASRSNEFAPSTVQARTPSPRENWIAVSDASRGHSGSPALKSASRTFLTSSGERMPLGGMVESVNFGDSRSISATTFLASSSLPAPT